MFRNMKIGSRLVVGFLIMSLVIGLVSVLSIMELRKVLDPLTEDIPNGLHEIEMTSHLDALAQRIRYYDQLLTESVRGYASSGNKKWKYRYRTIEPALSTVIREAIRKGDEEDKRIFSEIQKAKLAFVQIENQALDSVDNGNQTQALSLLEDENYWQLKEEYKLGIEKYVERRGKKYGETLEVTSSNVNAIVEKTFKLVEQSIHILIGLSLFGFLLALGMGLLVARSIVNPMKMLQKGVEIIGRGNLHHKIRVPSKDEIGQFAEAFNEMTQKLKESYTGLEDKVKEKTSELANKVEQIETQNKELEETKRTLEITNAKVEKEKVESEALIASIGDGMVVTDQNGNIVMLNHQAEVMFGWESAEVVGKHFAEIFPNEDEKGKGIPAVKRPISVALVSGRKIVATSYYIRKNKSRFPASITVSPVQLEGQTIGAIEIVRDITKEKEVDRMKNEFISTVSHELRTPLTVIREGVSLVIDGVLGKVNEKQTKFLRIALNDIDRLKRIIDNLLDISKIEAGKIELKREDVDMKTLVDGIVANFETRAHGKNLKIRAHYNADDINAYIDKDKMIQVFTNLIGNALKFTEEGGIDIYVDDKGMEGLECCVSDTGKGIAEEDLPKVFGKFQQFGRTNGSGEKGTGLGLSIAKGIVELHHGNIWVESKLEVGTKFIFKLPKFNPQDLLRHRLISGMREARHQKAPLSLVVFEVNNLEGVKHDFGQQRATDLMTKLDGIVRTCLRRQLDTTVRNLNAIFIILPTTEKQNAVLVAERIRASFFDHLTQEGLSEKVKIQYRVVGYPDDAGTEEELIQRAA